MWTTVKNVIMLAMMAASAVSEELTPQEKCEAEDELMCKKINTNTEEVVAYMTLTQVIDAFRGPGNSAWCNRPGETDITKSDCYCAAFGKTSDGFEFESCAPPATPPPTPAPPTPVPCVNPINPETSKHVIGYFPNWSQYRTPDNPEAPDVPDTHYVLKADGVNYCQLTHAVFSFATVQYQDFEFGDNPDYPDAQLKEYRQGNTHWENPDANKILAGEVVPMEWNDYVNWKLMKDTIAAQGAHTKMLLSIGGWTAGTNTFHEMAKDSTKMQRFIDSLFAISEKYGFVGVDLDWEYPGWITEGNGKFSWYNNEKAKDDEGRERNDARAAEDIVNFCTLITQLKTQAQEKFSFHYTISAAVKANPHKSLYNRACMAENLDWVGIMAYDYHGVWDAKSGMVGGHSALTDARLQDGQSTANAWTYWNEIVPSDKLVVGLATYGKGFKVQEVTPATENNLFITDPVAGKQYQGIAGTAYKGPYVASEGTNPYYEIIGHWPDRSQWHYDEDNFIWAVNGPDFIGFDDECTIINKTHWALQTQDAAGVMVWELSFDDVYNKYPLMSVIHDAAVDLDREVTCQRSQGDAIANTKFTAIAPPTAAPSPTTAAPSPTTAAPSPTTAAPSPTTAAPSPTTAPTTTAPTTTAPTTTTPPPTPKPTQSDNLSPGAVAAIAIACACGLAVLARF